MQHLQNNTNSNSNNSNNNNDNVISDATSRHKPLATSWALTPREITLSVAL
jgi:hypothetical protein